MTCNIDRRSFLRQTTGLLAGMAMSASADPVQAQSNVAEQEEPDSFVFSRLKFRTINNTQDEWDCGIDKEEELLAFLRTATNIKVSQKDFYARAVSIDDMRKAHSNPGKDSIVYTRPFIFMTGSGSFAFDEPESATLGEYLRRGGFWYIDDCISSPSHHSDFYRIFVRESKKIFPGAEMAPVPHDHEIYHCVFDIEDGAPHVQGESLPDMGLFIKDRLAVFLTSGDLHCGWRWEITSRSPHPDKAICRKMGTNIVAYALTH